MKYYVSFTMTGSVEVDTDDSVEALEEVEVMSKTKLLRSVKDVIFNSVKDEEGNILINL